jgi:transposase-like protein
MAGRSTYSPEDKAAVMAVLAANGGNQKRTSRETGIPLATLRYWIKHPESAPPSDEQVQAAVDSFVGDAQRIRDAALSKLEGLVQSDQVSARELITVVGVLDDKITRASGLPTQRTEHQHSLPTREELQLVLGAAVGSMIEMAERRDAEIVDGEVVEDAQYRALPSPRE